MKAPGKVIITIIVILIIGFAIYFIFPSRSKLVGKWTGTYSNVAVTNAVISVEFYAGGSGALCDLQNGEVRYNGPVTLNGWGIQFGVLSADEETPSINGTVNPSFNKIDGILTIDYFMHGRVSGPITLRRIE